LGAFAGRPGFWVDRHGIVRGSGISVSLSTSHTPASASAANIRLDGGQPRQPFRDALVDLGELEFHHAEIEPVLRRGQPTKGVIDPPASGRRQVLLDQAGDRQIAKPGSTNPTKTGLTASLSLRFDYSLVDCYQNRTT
jgi:hypothetical protein